MTDNTPQAPVAAPNETVVDLGGGFYQITRTDVEQRDDLSEADPADTATE